MTFDLEDYRVLCVTSHQLSMSYHYPFLSYDSMNTVSQGIQG